MKLYTFYTDTHIKFLCDYFLPSLEDNFELIIDKKNQLSKSGTYMENGWIETMFFKVDTIIKGITENINNQSLFIHSDIDIQFFGPVEEEIVRCANDCDIVFQKGARSINNGFFACRANQKNLRFWRDVKAFMEENNVHDEKSSKTLLGLPLDYYDDSNTAFKKFENKYGINWRYLPVDKFVGGQYCIESFESQKLIPPPVTTLMHHATSTVGFEGKIRQLEHVKKFIFRNKNPDF